MEYPLDQIEELKQFCENILRAEDGGIVYLLLKGLILPDGCEPSKIDALLCPVPRDGYISRLFFAEKIKSPIFDQLNWNASNVRILERSWHAYSWKISEPNLRLAQSVLNHLRAKKT